MTRKKVLSSDEFEKQLEEEEKEENSLIATSPILTAINAPTTSTIPITSTASTISPTPSFQENQDNLSSSNDCHGSFMWFCLN